MQMHPFSRIWYTLHMSWWWSRVWHIYQRVLISPAKDRPCLPLSRSWASVCRATSQLHGAALNTRLQTKALQRFVITEKAPTRAFSLLRAASTAFTFETLLRHYAKQALTLWFLNMKLGLRHKGHLGTDGLVSIVSYSRLSLMIIALRTQFHVERPWGQHPLGIVS